MNKLDDILEHMNCACSDGSCTFRPSTTKGLVTNGGCKCAGDYTKKHQIERLIRWMKREGKWDAFYESRRKDK